MDIAIHSQSSIPRRLAKIVIAIGILYLFLVSISLMGSAVKLFGKGFSEGLIRTTSNPFIGLFIGVLATSIIQSSSTTTSMIVGFVAGGALTIENAVPMVMGANIGTTVTNTIVSFAHVTRREEFKRAFSAALMHDFFNSMAVLILLPLELMTGFLRKSAAVLAGVFNNMGGVSVSSPIKIMVGPAVKGVKHFIMDTMALSSLWGGVTILLLALIFIFISLSVLVKLMKSLVIERTEIIFNKIIGKNGYVGILLGMLFTAIIQSSSVTTSLMVPMVGAGIISLEQVFPIALGANLGTTVTALLAALTGNVAGLTIAFVHLLFNVCGIALIYPWSWTRNIPIRLARFMGNKSLESRLYAIGYTVFIFFLLPIILIVLYRMF